MTKRKELLRDLPISLCAVGVSLCTLGNILLVFNFQTPRYLALLIGGLIIGLMLAKACLFPYRIREELDNPGIACIYPAFTMLLMLLAQTLYGLGFELAKLIWLVGVLVNVILIVVFFYKHLLSQFQLITVLPGWFVAFVGIGVAVITSGGMGLQRCVYVIWCFCLLAYAMLLPVVAWRIWKIPMGNQCYPSFTILAAPPSLCLVGYLTISPEVDFYLLTLLLFLGQGALILIYSRIKRFLSLKFSVSFASFTFPLAISTFALLKYSIYLAEINLDQMASWLYHLAQVELLIAVTVIGTVCILFIRHFATLLKNV